MSQKSQVPEFPIAGRTFVCWAEDDGRYVWRSGDLSAGRSQGRSTCWAADGDERVGSNFTSLRAAMIAAVRSELGRVAA